MADKNFYINFERGTRVNSDGSQDASTASLYYQEVPNWTIKFIDEAQAAVDVSGLTWASAVDDDFDDGSTPWCRILDADIDSTSAATGIITIPLDSNTSEFATGIGTSEYKQAYFELRGLNGSSELVAYVRFSILAKNTLDPGGGSPPAPTGNYYTKSESTALFVEVKGDTMTGDLNGTAGNDFTINGGDGGTGVNGGDLYIKGGLVGASATDGGDVIIKGGSGSPTDGKVLLKDADDVTQAIIDDSGVNIVTDLIFDNSGDIILDSSANSFVFKENANILATLAGDGTGVVFPDQSPQATATPPIINMGNTYSDSIAPSKAKLQLIETGGAYGGFGVSAGRIDYFAFSAAGHYFYVNGASTASFKIESDGTLSVPAGSYETLVTDDDDIPNRKFVLDSAYTMTNKTHTLPVLTTYAVASLPAAGTAGRKAFVTDANATTFASIVAGGGANGVPVYDDGTNWRIG